MMPIKTVKELSILSGLTLVLSLGAFLVNYFIYKYPGNNFFPENTWFLWITLVITYWGIVLLFGKHSKASDAGKEVLYFTSLMSLIALATNAVQLTPFEPIDQSLVKMDALFSIDMNALLAWTNQHPILKKIMEYVYDSLPYQMSILPLCVIATGRFYLLHEYYYLMLVTMLIGFIIYYFYPSTAPASIISNPLFSADQMATGYKFYQIHHHISPTTNAGGLIAMPSFHAIWAILGVYLLREWTIPCLLLAIVNVILIISCVLLGWHYFVDILGAVLVIGISFCIKNIDRILEYPIPDDTIHSN